MNFCFKIKCFNNLDKMANFVAFLNVKGSNLAYIAFRATHADSMPHRISLEKIYVYTAFSL